MSDIVKERGRQCKGGSLELIPRKTPGRATGAFLDQTKTEIGQTTREISRGMRINDREAVEAAVRDVLAPRPPLQFRRAA